MEIATRNVIFPGSVGLAQAHPLTNSLAMGDGLPPDLVQLRSTLPIRALVLGTLFDVPKKGDRQKVEQTRGSRHPCVSV